MPAYRNRMWDGKIRLFDMRNKTLYCGLLHYLREFCDERGYTLEPLDSKGLENIKWRHQNIKNMIEWRKFTSGI